MIQIAGTDYQQAEDMSIVAYDGGKHVLVASGNTFQLVQMSEFLEASGVTSYPHAAGWDLPTNFRINFDGYIEIGPSYRVSPYIQLTESSKQVWTEGDIVCLHSAIQTWISGENLSNGYTLLIKNSAGAPTRRAIADSWVLYASFAAEKESLRPIEEPLEKVSNIRGYTYKQGGRDKVGFTVDDIETAYPEALELNERGEIEGYDPNALLATAYEAISLLEERITLLEVQVSTLQRTNT